MCAAPGSAPVFLGTFTALAANEEGALVEAGLYRLELVGPIVAASEIEGNFLGRLCCRRTRLNLPRSHVTASCPWPSISPVLDAVRTIDAPPSGHRPVKLAAIMRHIMAFLV